MGVAQLDRAIDPGVDCALVPDVIHGADPLVDGAIPASPMCALRLTCLPLPTGHLASAEESGEPRLFEGTSHLRQYEAGVVQRRCYLRASGFDEAHAFSRGPVGIAVVTLRFESADVSQRLLPSASIT